MREEKKRALRPVQNPKMVEVKYRTQMTVGIQKMVRGVRAELVPALRRLQPQYVSDGYADELGQIFDRLRATYIATDQNARIIAESFVGNTNTVNKARFYNSVEGIIGVDLSNTIRNEDLTDVLKSTTRSNVNLIKSIPEEYFKTLENIVFTEVTQGSTATSMISQIVKLNGSTKNRARVIARDQTAKLNSALTQKRSENLGIEEYVWRTAGDGRVRELHRRNNGKTFRWDSPPKETGHPGHDIQCRCIAQPIIPV